MLKNYRWHFLVIFGLLAFYLFQKRPTDKLRLIACDVGQGDGFLFVHGHTQMLIDGGSDDQILSCLAKYMPLGDNTLEIVIATHPDLDHVGGLKPVLSRFQVASFVLPLCYKNTADFAGLYQLVQRKVQTGMKLINISQLNSFYLDGEIAVTRLWPDQNSRPNLNDCPNYPKTTLEDTVSNSSKTTSDTNAWSSVFLIRHGQVKILMTADIDTQVEDAMMRQNMLTDVNILKIAHHGSKESTGKKFLDIVRPETILISVGKNNSYGHPAPMILSRVEAMGAKVYRTDHLGDIELNSDGWRYSVKEPLITWISKRLILFHFLSTKTSIKKD